MADRLIQVLRMTITLGRSHAERAQEADALLVTFRAANAFVGAGRADMGTKMAVRLGYELAQKVLAAVEGVGSSPDSQ